MKKISVIMPVHNTREFLVEAVESVLAQTSAHFELLLIDDGSTDGSERIVDDYSAQDSRVRVLHEPQSGVAIARNEGIEMAEGEYLVFLDSDDYFDNPDALALIAKTADETQADVIFYGYTDLDMQTGKRRQSQRGYDTKRFAYDKAEWLSYIYDAGLFPTACWQMAVRRDFVERHGICFPEHVVCEDIDWGINVLYHARSYKYIDESLLTYRRNRKGSIMDHRGLAHLQGCMFAVRRWMTVPQDKRYLGLTNFVAHMYGFCFSYYTIIPQGERTKAEAEFKGMDGVLMESDKWNHHLIYHTERLLGVAFTSWMIRAVYRLFYAPGSVLGFLRRLEYLEST